MHAFQDPVSLSAKLQATWLTEVFLNYELEKKLENADNSKRGLSELELK